MKGKGKTILITFFCLILISIVLLLCVNTYVKSIGGKNIITPSDAKELKNIDCILVLGCFVENDGNPSDMLADRLKRGIELYKTECAPKIIMSGDHGQTSYDEVNTMKKLAVDSGIPSDDVFMDHAGFSTYESLYRAKEIFKADRMIIVTQKYHLYRALYIAKALGIEAYGVDSDYRTYFGQSYRDMREVLARCKDFVKSLFKPEPTFLGEAIPVSGNGNLTNDQFTLTGGYRGNGYTIIIPDGDFVFEKKINEGIIEEKWTHKENELVEIKVTTYKYTEKKTIRESVFRKNSEYSFEELSDYEMRGMNENGDLIWCSLLPTDEEFFVLTLKYPSNSDEKEREALHRIYGTFTVTR